MYEHINSYYISIQEALSFFLFIYTSLWCVYGDQKQFIAILRAAGTFPIFFCLCAKTRETCRAYELPNLPNHEAPTAASYSFRTETRLNMYHAAG